MRLTSSFLLAGLLVGGCAQVKSFFGKEGMPEAAPTTVASSEASASSGTSSDPAWVLSARDAQAQAEILKEMFDVVTGKPPADLKKFSGWLSGLHSGASLEGIYNGIVSSEEYRAKETGRNPATPKVFGRFADEMVWIQSQLKEPTVFTREDAQPIEMKMPEPVFDAAATPVTETDMDTVETPPSEPAFSADISRKELQNLFVGAPFYTLKRVIGREVLKLIHQNSGFLEQYAHWYSRFAVRFAKTYSTSFGLELRRNTDEGFHYQWAIDRGVDRSTWEVLNRYHRLLNQEQAKGIR